MEAALLTQDQAEEASLGAGWRVRGSSVHVAPHWHWEACLCRPSAPGPSKFLQEGGVLGAGVVQRDR